MTKFSYTENDYLKTEILNARTEILPLLTRYQKSAATFDQEEELHGETWASAKQRINFTSNLARSIHFAMVDIGQILNNYLNDFTAQVGDTTKLLDSDQLAKLQEELKSLNNERNAFLAQLQTSAKWNYTGSTLLGTSYTDVGTDVYDGRIDTVSDEIDLLKKYISFESSHNSEFDQVISALDDIEKGLKALNEDQNFDDNLGQYVSRDYTNDKWYADLVDFNTKEREDQYDMKVVWHEIIVPAGNTIGYEKCYDVYVNGEYDREKTEQLELQAKGANVELADLLGLNDLATALSGIDPKTGKKVSGKEQAMSALLSLLFFLPWGAAGKVLKNVSTGSKALSGLEEFSPIIKAGEGSSERLTKEEALKLLDQKGSAKAKSNISKWFEENAPKSDGSNGKVIKLSDMTESEKAEIANQIKSKAPVDIPENAKVKAQSKNAGYEQILYKWRKN